MSNYENANIYYLSGTGNTYRVATWAGETLDSQKIKVHIKPAGRHEERGNRYLPALISC